jgi:hypothetical protein
MKKYNPNFNDPRVISRCKQALGFACGVLSETKPQQWSTRHIDIYFGQQRTDISKYLRKTLLICTDNYVRFNIPGEKGICKKYILNTNGVRSLRENLKINNIQLYPIVYDLAKQDHQAELESGLFQYKDKSCRLWHPLQRYKKDYRTQILAQAGYIHDYDIECCAPTLILQYAQSCGMDLWLCAINNYLTNKTAIRQQLSQSLELDISVVKEIINALFAGAVISYNSHSDIYKMLNGDQARIECLKQDPFITELKSDIKICWEYIAPYMSRRRKANTNRLLAISPKQKWNVYFDLERVVMSSVRTYLDHNSVRYFLLHDGWSCERELDLEQLRDYVRTNTGYEVKFKHERLEISERD